MNALAKVSQGRFTNSVAVRPRAAPAAPTVLQMLALSIATLNEKVDALAARTAQPPARIAVESRDVSSTSLAPRPVATPSVRPSAAPRDEPQVNRRRIRDFFD